ncbi:hypothetical protein QBC42DRAFT_247129 [Cladorrhinum samala]|uniref:Uncharacterized protein n=1 Tax=Cladorrhinum samala TaxID=585594 RepID=A0AAV9I547_9PEZI|nr:hypothetical protein QBC42DRAFT_247129 [Cladorrhinum samala]
MPPEAAGDRSVSALERLPLELRRNIYEYLFDTHGQVRPGIGSTVKAFGLLLVNKAISQDARYHLYSTNTFRVAAPIDGGCFNRIGRFNSNSIRKVVLVFDSQSTKFQTHLRYMQTTLRKRCTALRTIEYEFSLPLAAREILCHMTARPMRSIWYYFKHLQVITIAVPERSPPETDETLYRLLAKQSKAPLVVCQFIGAVSGSSARQWLEIRKD